MASRAKKIIAAFSLAMLVTGCMSIDLDRTVSCSGEDWLESTLYLGRTMNRAPVSDEAWQAFVESDVTPRFPDGFTFLNGHGAWKNAQLGKTIYENSTLLIILHPDTDQNRSNVQAMAEAYRTTFDQEAVLKSHKKVCVEFIAG